MRGLWHVFVLYILYDCSIIEKLHYILSVKSDFHMTDKLWLDVHAFVCRVFMYVSVNEILLPMLVNVSTNF